MSQSSPDADAPRHSVTFGEALKVWVRVAALSFGGPAGQIAVMHRILVLERKWVSEYRFLHALNYCMLLPGPEAQQLATYIGWLLHRTRGGLAAGALFVLPGFLSILALSVLYSSFQQLSAVQALFFGLKPAVMAVVLEAVIRIGERALRNALMVGLAAAAFVAIFFLQVPFPLIVIGAAAAGWIGGKVRPDRFDVLPVVAAKTVAETPPALGDRDSGPRPTLARAVRVTAVWLLLWFGPLVLIGIVLGRESVLVQQGLFFSKMAVVTFGGAYAVLAYVAQQGVETYGWLKPGEMLDALGMAETTPGPLIQVVQFVGFMGAWRNPGDLDPMVAAVLGSVVTTWVTFVPCFLWIFLGAPYAEYLRGNRSLNAVLSAITAAVVGVVLNLAVWFSLHSLFGVLGEFRPLGIRLLVPQWETLDVAAALIAVAAFLAMFRFRVGMILTLGGSVVVGTVYYLALRA